MKAKYYALGLVLAYAVIGGWIYSIMRTIPQYSGDLSRVGGFSESQFGPRANYHHFNRNVTDFGQSIRDYNSYYDVIVIGDSFSNARAIPSPAWQNFLSAKTGLRILSFHCDNLSLRELMSSPVFRSNPPRAVIFESAENGLHTKLTDFPPVSVPAAPPKKDPFTPKPMQISMRDVSHWPVNGCDFNTAVHHATLQVKRALGIRVRSSVQKLNAPPAGLFSSTINDSMLVYYGDSWKLKPTSADWALIAQRFLAAQNAIQNNGKTHFTLMMAPDRSSIYGRWYANNHELRISVFEATDQFTHINTVPTLSVLRDAVYSGKTDVYLPNDTHWSSVGHELAAQAVEQHFRDQLVIE
jgi:hypothetical protein